MPVASPETNSSPRLFPITQDLFGDDLGALLGSGVTIGAAVAIGMTLLLEAMNTRRQRLEVTLDMAALPRVSRAPPEVPRCGHRHRPGRGPYQ